MSKVIIFPHKKIFLSEMTFGPAIRLFQIAKVLARKGHDVTIAEKKRLKEEVIDLVKFVPYNQELLNSVSKDYDVAITDLWSNENSFLHSLKDIPLIVDVSAPIIIEHALFFDDSEKQARHFTDDIVYPLTRIFTYGDVFLCANEKQRIYYAGILSIFGRINPCNADASQLMILPTGLSQEEFVSKPGMLSGKIVPKNKKIILWPGGIFPWFDALSPIKAMQVLSKKYPYLVMVFAGSINPRAPKSLTNKNFKKARKLAEELGLLNKNVFFIEWLPYKERAGLYTDSEFAVITSKCSLESELANRTRVLECLWGRLPVIYNGNDELSKLITDYSLGKIIHDSSPNKLAETISKFVEDDNALSKIRLNLKRFTKSNLRWEDIIEPLDTFCKNPRKNSEDKAFTPHHLLSERLELLKEKEGSVRLLKTRINEKNSLIKSLKDELKNQRRSFERAIDEQRIVTKGQQRIIEEQQRAVKEQQRAMKEQQASFEKIIEEKEEVLNKIFNSKAWKVVRLLDNIRGK